MKAVSAVEKYLNQYAETELLSLRDWPHTYCYQHCLVIPAYDEAPDFFHRLHTSTLTQQRLLLILVINRPDHIATCPANSALLDSVANTLPKTWQQENVALYDNGQWGVLCVDRHKTPIPKKQGVGLARKLGCDLAARLIASNMIASPWIHSTDADAFLPDDYFSCAQQLQKNTAAATYDFQHRRGGDATARATEEYERTLCHYVDGLKHAGSPYAYHTIGSILVINHIHYCQARGFPKRSGGEDFYLLNKLAKLGNIESLPAKIELQPRLSHRVPFGTGPATFKIQQSMENGLPLLSYDPIIFDCLKECIETLEESIQTSLPLDQALSLLPAISQKALLNLDVHQCIKHLQQNSDTTWKKKHLHCWLDAFRTLKFVHFLQAEAFPPLPLPKLMQPSASSH